MDLFRVLSDFLLKAYGAEELSPIISSLEKNGFDIKKTVSDLNPNTVLPVLKNVFSALSKETNKDGGGYSTTEKFGAAPITDFADEEIVSRLNQYLG